jgi:hypothetical protein
MEEIKEFLLGLLQEFDYKEDKEQYVNEFLHVCQQQATAEILKEAKSEQDLEEKKFTEVFNKTVASNIGKLTEAVLPLLSEGELDKFNTYLSTLSEKYPQ